MKSSQLEPEALGRVRLDYSPFEKATGLNWYQIDPNLQHLVERYTAPQDRPWCEAKLQYFGALCGGPIAERAEITDKNPPRLERYDRWGEEINRVVHHPAALETKRDLWEAGYTYLRRHATLPSGRPVPGVVLAAFDYLLSQADTGMTCATGMTAGVARLIERHASEPVKQQFLPHMTTPHFEEAMDGAMFMTERAGGSDLSTTSTVARRRRGQWYLTGSKWFCSNVDAALIVTLARPEDAGPGLANLSLFLVPNLRQNGEPNGIRIRRLKDKLGTRTVPTGEVDFDEAEAYLLSGDEPDAAAGRGINRMMEMVTLSRLGVAAMGLGVARRCFVEAAIYAARRTAFGQRLDQFPLVKETLAQLVVEVEASTALYFAAALEEEPRRRRLLIPLAKFRTARLGVEAATQALEMHGGNGYIENWPMARLLREAQCHTIWEGTENIICLDVLRSMAKEQTHEAVIAWVEGIWERTDVPLLAKPRQTLRQVLNEWKGILVYLAQTEREMTQLHARRITQYLAEVAQAALLLDEAAGELAQRNSARKALVAALFIEKHFVNRPDRGITAPDRQILEGFDILTRYGRLAPGEAGRWLG